MDLLSPATPAYTHAQIKRVVTGIMLCVLLAALDQTVVIPAVPAIADDLRSFGHLSWIVTAYLLTSTAATPIYGKLSDIYGRRALLLPAIGLFIAASMLCGFAQSLPQLIAARALQGVGGAGLLSMAQAAMADVVSPRERGRYQGYLASMWGVASIAGPIVGGYATDHLSWRWVFWVNLPLGIAAIWLCDRALRDMPVVRRSARIDWLGAGLLVAGVTSCLMVLSWGGVEYPWGSAPVLSLAVAGMLLVLALAWWETRVPDPILPPRLFQDRTFLSGVLIGFFASLGLFGATFLLPLYFQLSLGQNASSSGLLVMPFLAATVVGAYMAGQLARRSGRVKRTMVLSLAAATLGLVALVAHGSLWFVLVASTVLGAGIGSVMPSMLVMVQTSARPGDVGAATGSLLFLRSMGGAFGTTIVGSLLVLQFNAGLHRAGLGIDLDLGALRRGAEGAGLGALGRDGARTALEGGFQLSFGVCAALMAVACVIAATMRDIELRSTADPAPVGH